jgi:hypothetical protein
MHIGNDADSIHSLGVSGAAFRTRWHVDFYGDATVAGIGEFCNSYKLLKA